MAEHNKLGQEGEAIACEYLLQQGYTIKATNWHKQHKEVDIIAENEERIVFVEVKTRSNEAFGYPEESVHSLKQHFLAETAQHYLDIHPSDKEIRFDIISVVKADETRPSIHHIRDAFWPGK